MSNTTINLGDLSPEVQAKILAENPQIILEDDSNKFKGISPNIKANAEKKKSVEKEKLRKVEFKRKESLELTKEQKETLAYMRAVNGGFNSMLDYLKKQQAKDKDILDRLKAKGKSDKALEEKYNEQSDRIDKLVKAFKEAEYENLSFRQKVEFKKAQQKEFNEELKKREIELRAAVKAGDKDATDAAQKAYENQLKKKQDLKLSKFELFAYGLTNAAEKGVSASANESLNEFLSKSPQGQAILTIAKGVDRINTTLNKGVTQAVNMASEYLGKIDARLQGSGMSTDGRSSYGEYISAMTSTFATSPFVKQESLLKNISDIVGQGIAFNVEERALVATLAEKMVTTFDALDASLTRLVRIQGADLTYSSMGSEALLTQFLNTNFKDTSYLNSLYDSVSSAVLDASAQLDYQSAIGFNYAVQKWLGSLYSVGMSESGVSTIAQGLNYLATGNVDALGGNTQLQTLLALSAKNAGLDYASILRTGLNADNTNMLLESMVEYLKGIYGSIDNNVVKSAWSNIAGLNITDLRALSNLSSGEIAAISASNTNFGTSTEEFKRQLGLVQGRTTLAERFSNLGSNAILSFGNSMVNLDNIYPYLGWMLGDAIGGTLGSVIQAVSGVATFLLSDDIGLKDVLTGNVSLNDSIFGNIPSDIAALFSNNRYTGFDDYFGKGRSDFFTHGVQTERAANYIPLIAAMSSTDMSKTTSRGAEWVYTNAAGSVESGVSTSITNASTADQMEGSLVNNEVATLSSSNITGASIQVRDIGDLYAKLFEHRDTPIKVTLSDVEDEAKKKLLVDFLTDMSSNLEYLANQASGTGINVDLGSEDANIMRSQIYNVRYSY